MPPSDSHSSDRLLTLAEALAAGLHSIQPLREIETVPL
ncbi:MAG: hypothetical protein H6R48_823, partial [Proteobacteria bacterium]|nr:hypothetical protein [Pseudomonadota bacterium]MBS1248034.1 hypothetical protein [Pseudomonadota bacterium]